MDPFQLTRSTLAQLLLAIRDQESPNPLNILLATYKLHIKNITELDDLKSPIFPSILKKICKKKQEVLGLSVNEIASLGNHLEYVMVTPTAIQNWVKRDIRELIGSPTLGKKYSADQAAILFIVEDLRVALDFDSIRKVLTLIFNNPADRTDDIIDPVLFYKGYSDIFEQIKKQSNSTNIEETVEFHAENFVTKHQLKTKEKAIVKNLVILAVMTIHSSLYQSKARAYLSKTLFM